MLSFYFKDFFIIIPFFLYSISFWTFFIKNNFYIVKLNPLNNDLLKSSKILKKVHFIFFINWININYFFFLLFLFFIKLDYNIFWFNHLKFNNFNFNLIVLVFFVSYLIIYIVKFLKSKNVNYNLDYFSSLINLTIFVPIMFLSNSIYTFFFLLELSSLIILYKFSVSRTWFDNKNNLLSNNFNRVLPKNYINMLFFQYWANFFSSMLLMFSIFNLIFIFGSSEWIFLNYTISSSNYNFFSIKFSFLTYIWIFFFVGMFLKIGFSPLHLFKIEVYRGIPFISIFFYTTWYFLSFFLYFVVIVYNNIFEFSYFFNYIFFIFILVGLFYTIFLIFDINLLKSFFAYSTIINVLNFIIVLYLIII